MWRIDDLYLAHLALTDIDRGSFRYYKRLNRAGPGIAGASFDQARVWNATGKPGGTRPLPPRPLRQAGGVIDPFSYGTYIASDGSVTHLKRADFELRPIDWWTSPRTRARYPIKWRVTVPSLHLALECAAAIPAQELVSEDDDGPPKTHAPVEVRSAVSPAGQAENSTPVP